MSRLSRTGNVRIFVGALVALAVVVGVVAVVKLDPFGSRGSGLGGEFTYDVGDLARIDPNLILYEESAQPISTGFAKSHAVAVDSKGIIYVAGDKAVRVFSAAGDLLSKIGLAGPGAPSCLALAGDDRIYIGVKDHVRVYDVKGQRLARWGSLGDDAILTSIAVWKDNVFVADAGNRIVVRYDRTGNLVNKIGKKDVERNVPGFVIPSPYFDLAVLKDGLLRVVNPGRLRIEAYTFDGDFEFFWGESSVAVEGFCGCCNPVNIAVLPKGGFVTCEKGLIRVKVYDAEGEFVGVVAGPDQLLEDGTARVCEFPGQCQAGGFDVAVDAAGRIFVLDTIKNVVRIFTRIKAK